MSPHSEDPRALNAAAVDAVLNAAPPAEPRARRASKRTEISAGWRGRLIVGNEGKPKSLLANAITALRYAPEWEGVLGFNEFAFELAVVKPAPWGTTGNRWTDHEDRLTTEWLQRNGIHVGVEVAGQAVQTVAKDRLFHPVREYLDLLQWDGIHRIDEWLSLYLGAEGSDYTAAVGSRWLISAVARIYRPGAKVDCCPILEGPQGIGKSTAIKILAGDWFTDDIAELGTKDSALQSQGVWIVELSELDSMRGAEVSKIKAFMSRPADRVRPPYAKRAIEVPRQCVFAGTVNKSAYLRDETGARRFWPVLCGQIDQESLTRDRDQLWAEARERYEVGAIWWLDTPKLTDAAAVEQDSRYEADPWQPLIEDFVESHDCVTVPQILAQCIHKPEREWTQIDQNRVARTLRAIHWERYQHRFGIEDGLRREWRYRKPQA